MDNPASPPATSARLAPDVASRIVSYPGFIYISNSSQEENRRKARALREQSIAAEASSRTRSSFIVPDRVNSEPISRKRPAAAISTTGVPATSRDARQKPEEPVQVARKFRKEKDKYIDHDFSKMTDTKGGFLTAEDDPFNKAMRAAKDGEKPAHMSLKEWERHQILKGLRYRKEGIFEPGINIGKPTLKCRECGTMEIDWQWEEVFKCIVCNGCKDKFPEKYSLLTKTEAKDDYLLTDRKLITMDKSGLTITAELKDPELLPHLNKPNPHKAHWHDMMLFLRYQVEEYAINTKWGSAEALDAEFERREAEKTKRKEDKFKTKLKELKKKTRTEAFMRKGQGRGGNFGDAVGSGKHEHEWGQLVENADGMSVKTCVECGMEVEEIVF